MAALLHQLRRLHTDLAAIVERYPAQDVHGLAIPMINAVINEARLLAPLNSTIRTQVSALVPEVVEGVVSVRAVDAFLVIGQLLAVFEYVDDERRVRVAPRGRLDGRR